MRDAIGHKGRGRRPRRSASASIAATSCSAKARSVPRKCRFQSMIAIFSTPS